MDTDGTMNDKSASRWRWRLFQGILPIQRSRIIPDLMAGVTLAAMNIPQAMGYTKIAGTPVIVLSGKTKDTVETICQECGASSFVIKPYNPTLLLNEINRFAKPRKDTGPHV